MAEPEREQHAEQRGDRLPQPCLTEPKIVACTVSSAAQGARNGWVTCRNRADTSQASTAASAVLTSWDT